MNNQKMMTIDELLTATDVREDLEHAEPAGLVQKTAVEAVRRGMIALIRSKSSGLGTYDLHLFRLGVEHIYGEALRGLDASDTSGEQLLAEMESKRDSLLRVLDSAISTAQQIEESMAGAKAINVVTA